jgi:hypothetical protein
MVKSVKSPTNHHILASLGVRISSLFSGCQRQPPKLGRVGASVVGHSEPRPRGPEMVIHRAMAIEAMAQFSSMFYCIENGGFSICFYDQKVNLGLVAKNVDLGFKNLSCGYNLHFFVRAHGSIYV